MQQQLDTRFYEVTATLCGALFFASFALAQLILDRSLPSKVGASRVAGFLFAALVIGALFFNGMLYSLMEFLPENVRVGELGFWSRGLGVVALLLPALIFTNTRAREGLSAHLGFAIRNDPLGMPYGAFLWLLIVALGTSISFTNDTSYTTPKPQFPLDPLVETVFFIGGGSFAAMLATIFCFFTYSEQWRVALPAEIDWRKRSEWGLARAAAVFFLVAGCLFELGTLLPEETRGIFWLYQALRWCTVLVSGIAATVLWTTFRRVVVDDGVDRYALLVAFDLLILVAILKNTAFPLPFTHTTWYPWDHATFGALFVVAFVLAVASKRARETLPRSASAQGAVSESPAQAPAIHG